jgi:hypothetical protein
MAQNNIPETIWAKINSEGRAMIYYGEDGVSRETIAAEARKMCEGVPHATWMWRKTPSKTRFGVKIWQTRCRHRERCPGCEDQEEWN